MFIIKTYIFDKRVEYRCWLSDVEGGGKFENAEEEHDKAEQDGLPVCCREWIQSHLLVMVLE